MFKSEANNMIIARDIEVYSLCEHHMLPFFGRCHIGYIATNKVLGVSKLARHRGLLRPAAADPGAADRARSPARSWTPSGAEGVGVVMECRHLCMMMRGVEKQNSVMTTSSVLGSFHDDAATRVEFLTLIGRHVQS